MKNGEKSVSCVVYYKKPYLERPQKDRPAIKGKTNPERMKRKTARAVNHFLLRLWILFRPNAIWKD